MAHAFEAFLGRTVDAISDRGGRDDLKQCFQWLTPDGRVVRRVVAAEHFLHIEDPVKGRQRAI